MFYLLVVLIVCRELICRRAWCEPCRNYHVLYSSQTWQSHSFTSKH